MIVCPLVATRSHKQHNRNVIGPASRLEGSATHLNISIGAKNISIPHQIHPHQIFNFGPQTGDTQNGLTLIQDLTVTLKIQTNANQF